MTTRKRTTRAKPATNEQPQPAAATANDQGILANNHDVDKLGEEIGKLLDGLAQRGLVIDINRLDVNNLKARVEAFAACRILVEKGICTQAEMAATCNREFKAILGVILQLVEERMLASQPPREDKIIKPRDGGKLAVASPKLAVVRH